MSGMKEWGFGQQPGWYLRFGPEQQQPTLSISAWQINPCPKSTTPVWKPPSENKTERAWWWSHWIRTENSSQNSVVCVNVSFAKIHYCGRPRNSLRDALLKMQVNQSPDLRNMRRKHDSLSVRRIQIKFQHAVLWWVCKGMLDWKSSHVSTIRVSWLIYGWKGTNLSHCNFMVNAKDDPTNASQSWARKGSRFSVANSSERISHLASNS